MHIQTKNCYNGQNWQMYKLGIMYWEQKEKGLKYLTHFFFSSRNGYISYSNSNRKEKKIYICRVGCNFS